MPLTDVEQSIAKAVAQYYMANHEAVTHEQLLRRFEAPSVIIRLTHLRVLVGNNVASGLAYFPTILTFFLCGDDSIRQLARRAVEVAVRDLKGLFRTNYQMNRLYATSELPGLLSSANYAPDLGLLRLGVFFAKEIPGVLAGVQQDDDGRITSLRISEHVLSVDPTTVWEEHLRTVVPAELAPVAMSGPAGIKPPSEPEKKGWPPPGWRIERSLNEGGQGWTYLVRRKGGSDRAQYVLKRLKNKDRLVRFQSEVAALTKLQHPGILKVVETGVDADAPFFVAEYCDGHDLGKANLSGKDLLAKLRIFRQVCDAVASAHGANILHRDLKPQNIFVRKDDSIVVGDFGLCIDLSDATERATQTLEGVGAARFIAPEAEKGRVDEPHPTSDIYSLGKVLYFILGGRTLVREEYAQGEDDLRTRESGPNMHFIYELFDKTIRERPQDRFQSAADLLYALDSVIERGC